MDSADRSAGPVAMDTPVDTTGAKQVSSSRQAVVEAARRDPALVLMLAAAFLSASGVPVFTV